MKKKIFYTLLLSCVYLCISVLSAEAGTAASQKIQAYGQISGIIEKIIALVKNGNESYVASFMKNAKIIFFSLSTLYVLWSALEQIMTSRGDFIGAFLPGFFRTLVCLLIFNVFLVHSWDLIINPLGNFFCGIIKPDGNIISSIANSFANLASLPSEIYDAYISGVDTESFLDKVTHLFGVIIAFFPMLFYSIAASFSLTMCLCSVVTTIIVAEIDFYITELFAILALGFWGSQFTRDIAMNALRAVVAAAIHLTAIFLTCGIINNFTKELVITVNKLALADKLSFTTAMAYMNVSLIAGFAFTSVIKSVPAKISSLFGSFVGAYSDFSGQSSAISGGKAAIRAVARKAGIGA